MFLGNIFKQLSNRVGWLSPWEKYISSLSQGEKVRNSFLPGINGELEEKVPGVFILFILLMIS